jgi:hypothetical protein
MLVLEFLVPPLLLNIKMCNSLACLRKKISSSSSITQHIIISIGNAAA